jgi:iron complex outermembrane receptor protein
MVSKRRGRPSSGQKTTLNMTARHRRTALSVAVAAALTGTITVPAIAQDEVVEEVLVYGQYRRSLVDQIATKRDATTIVEAISAEDIGKLPDSSIAESLSRLPGLAGERRNGRTSGLSVRGFREDYIGTTLNGREIIGIGDNRGVEFDLYPAEIMSGVVVYKAPEATLTTQGIGGVVDLRTLRPLDEDNFFGVFYNYEDNEFDSANPDFDSDGHRLALNFSRKFADDTIGLALAFASTDSPSQEQQFRGWGYPTVSPANAGPGVTLTGDEVTVAGHDSFARSATLERDTVAGVLQFAPSDAVTLTFDALYIDFREDKAFRGIEEGGAVWGTGDYTITGVEDGFVTSGFYDGFLSVIRNDAERKDAELTSFGFNMDYQVNENWTTKLDVARSESDKTITNIESYAGVGRPGTGNQGPLTARSWTSGPNGTVYGPHPTIAPVALDDFNTIRLAGPQAWGGGLSQVDRFQPTAAFPDVGPSQSQDGFVNQPIFDESLTTMRIDASRPLDWKMFTGVDLGFYYADREKSKDNNGAFLTASTWPSDGPIPEAYRLGTTNLDFMGLGNIVAYDSLGLLNDGFYIETDAALLQPDREGDTYTIAEEITNLFAKVDFDTNLGDITLSGNLGVQIVHSDQVGRGFDSFIGPDGFVQATPTEDGDDYTDVLPSLNLNFGITDNQMVRFAAAKTQSRPRLDQMRPNNQVSFNFNLLNVTSTDPLNSAWSGSSGNARLRPLEANQFDLSYDWYFADDGFMSLAYFHKDLTNWHRNSSTIADFSQFFIPGYHQVEDTDGNVVTPAIFLGRLDFIEDGLQGDVSGFDLQANFPFRMVSPMLDGLGVIASASFFDGELDDGGQVPGLSDEIYQLTVYYERGGFQARVAGTKRSKFATEEPGLSLALTPTIDQGAEILDAQLSFDFGLAGIERFDGLTISLQAQNLTDEDTVRTNDATREITRLQGFGANYLLGINYKIR